MTGRSDLVAALEPLVRRVRTDVTAKKGPKGQHWTREPLTPERLAQHVNGGPARGVCPIKAGESVTMVGLLDLDSHKGESTWEDMAQAAKAVCAELEARFMAPVCFRSSGGRGIHIYVLWDEPQDAYSVRQELKEAIGALGYRNGTGGVKYGQIEVFPKQDYVPPDGFGNQFILPLAGASEPLDPDMQPMGKGAAVGMDWPTSAPVPVRDKPTKATTSVGGPALVDPDLAERALMFIPNKDMHGITREEWFRILCAYKMAGGSKEVACEWTAQHSSHDDKEFDKAWDSIKLDREDGAPAEYLFTVAQRHGFNEHIVREFSVEVAEEPGAQQPQPMPPLQRDKKGAIEPTASNAVAVLRRPDVCKASIAYDEFKDTTLIAWEGEDQWRPMRDTDYTRLRSELERIGFKRPGRELVRDAALLVAEENTFDSAVEWGNSLRWDGVPRVDGFLERYAQAESSDYTRAVSRYLWTALAARLLQPGAKCDMVPVLVGGQGTGKSSGVMALAPEPDAYVEVNLEHRDDNLARSLRGKLVGELGELRGLMTREAEAIKAWITRTHEEWIPKYMEFATKFPRRLVFIGTTNSEEFLADDTGERRWLPVRVGSVDVEAIKRDRDQLWGEAVEIFKREGLHWREAMGLAVHHHEEFKVTDPWTEPVREWLLADEMDGSEGAPRGMRPFKIDAVLTGALQLDAKRWTSRESRRVASILRGLGFDKRRASAAEGGKHVWEATAKCKLFELA